MEEEKRILDPYARLQVLAEITDKHKRFLTLREDLAQSYFHHISQNFWATQYKHMKYSSYFAQDLTTITNALSMLSASYSDNFYRELKKYIVFYEIAYHLEVPNEEQISYNRYYLANQKEKLEKLAEKYEIFDNLYELYLHERSAVYTLWFYLQKYTFFPWEAIPFRAEYIIESLSENKYFTPHGACTFLGDISQYEKEIDPSISYDERLIFSPENLLTDETLSEKKAQLNYTVRKRLVDLQKNVKENKKFSKEDIDDLCIVIKKIQGKPFSLSSNWARAIGNLLFEQYSASLEKDVDKTVHKFMESEFYNTFNEDISYNESNGRKLILDGNLYSNKGRKMKITSKEFSDLKRWLKSTIDCVEKGEILAFR